MRPPQSGLFEKIWEPARNDPDSKNVENGKIAADPSLGSTLDYFLRLADRCVEQGKISPREYACLVEQCGKLKKALVKIGDRRGAEREIPIKIRGRMLRP